MFKKDGSTIDKHPTWTTTAITSMIFGNREVVWSSFLIELELVVSDFQQIQSLQVIPP